MMNLKSYFYKIKEQFVILTICFSIALLLATYANDEFLMKSIYAIPSITNQTRYPQLILDNSSVPMINYGGNIGLQRNPLTVDSFALKDYNDYKQYGNDTFRKAFLNNVNWLVHNAVSHTNSTISEQRLSYPPYSLVNKSISQRNYSILEYKFPFPQYDLTPPWRSAYAQGQALQVFIRAYESTGNKTYLESATMILNSFFVEAKDGGVTYKTPTNGWWYEGFAGKVSMEPRTLDSMMIALLGIYEYYNFTKDPGAKYIFDQGVLALEKNLPSYDYKNGNSYFDVLGNVASKQDHCVQVVALNKLYYISKEGIFKLYHDRWQNAINGCSSK